MTEETINELLRNAVNTVVGIGGYAIRAQQKDAPRPSGAYAAVEYFSSMDTGWDEIQYANSGSDLSETISSHRILIYFIDFFRDNALENARKVKAGMQRFSVQNLFQQAEVGLIKVKEVKNISEPIETGWEERSQLEVHVSAVYIDTETGVIPIESIDIDGTTGDYSNVIEIREN